MADGSKALQLLLGRLGAAVPGLGKAGNSFAEIRPRELRCGESERVVGKPPDLFEHVAARPTVAIAFRGTRLHHLLQGVHPRIGVPPRIAEQFRVESLDHALETGQLEQMGALRHKKANAKLYRGTA